MRQLPQRRMAACRGPVVAKPDHLRPVHLQSLDGRPASRRLSQENRCFFAPVEVLFPLIVNWMKQRHVRSAQWIRCADTSRLVAVAHWTAQAEIRKCRLPARRDRHDVIDLERDAHQVFGAAAEGATSAAPGDDATP